jgi:hypothetical protein
MMSYHKKHIDDTVEIEGYEFRLSVVSKSGEPPIRLASIFYNLDSHETPLNNEFPNGAKMVMKTTEPLKVKERTGLIRRGGCLLTIRRALRTWQQNYVE